MTDSDEKMEAYRLARRVSDYWREKGVKVNARVIHYPNYGYGVITDLINGLPQTRRARKKDTSGLPMIRRKPKAVQA